MTRYLTGLGLAFLTVGLVAAGTIGGMALAAGRSPRLNTILDVWVFFGLLTITALAVIVGPLVLFLRRTLGARFGIVKAAATGAALGPLMLMPVFLITRESYETFGNLLTFWSRLPMEFVLGALPYVAAGALFAAWLVAGRPARRRIA